MDVNELLKDRMYLQYAENSFMQSFSRIYPDEAQRGIGVFLDNLTNDIDIAYGHQLNVLGNISGIPRASVASVDTDFFGYEGTLRAGGYNEYPYINSQQDVGLIPITDVVYRKAIRLQRLRNITDGTPDSLVAFFRELTQDPLAAIIDQGNMKYSVTATLANMDPDADLILNLYPDIVPRPCGVEFDGFEEFPPDADWILYDTFWNDDNEWIDTQLWLD